MRKTSWKRIAVVLWTIFLCIGCDQATKAIARAVLPHGGVHSFAGGVVKVRYAENKGGVLAFES
ncbi:MAG: hypothetical protein GX443_17900 [Deltaproteobacteria bacterium]|nr:hypothetical protein [Deltaproteobacteria bacterium]